MKDPAALLVSLMADAAECENEAAFMKGFGLHSPAQNQLSGMSDELAMALAAGVTAELMARDNLRAACWAANRMLAHSYRPVIRERMAVSAKRAEIERLRLYKKVDGSPRAQLARLGFQLLRDPGNTVQRFVQRMRFENAQFGGEGLPSDDLDGLMEWCVSKHQEQRIVH